MSLCQYTLVNRDKWGLVEELMWKQTYEGYNVTLINKIEYKWISIDILMSESDKRELQDESVITMEDIADYSWELIDSEEGTSDWTIEGDAPDEIKLYLKDELEKNGYMNLDQLGWGNDSGVSTGIRMYDNTLMFDE